MKFNYHSKAGFTMIEILVAVIIVITLVTMAVPLYDRAIEKSRIGEASITLKRIGESKLRVMNNRDITTFTQNAFTLGELDTTVPTSADWTYSLYPSSYANAVCAVRTRGANKGVRLLYLGEAGEEKCTCSTKTYSSSSTVCGAYCNSGTKLFCNNGIQGGNCEAYGMSSSAIGRCL